MHARGQGFESPHLHFSSRELKPNEVRIAVKAIGVNRADILQRRGLYPPPVGLRADVLGLECAGIIIEVFTDGIEAHSDWVGRDVMVLISGEAYATEVIVDIGCVMPIPKHLSMTEAAAIPEAFITAYDALWIQSGLQFDKSVCTCSRVWCGRCSTSVVYCQWA